MPPPSTISQLNSTLTGRYRVDREIGRGGMATVYLARDARHDRMVALKVLDPELGAVLGAERFLAEIKVTANLQHPNLLPLFDSGEAAGLLFYVMPFVEGETLRTRLEREKQLPVAEAVRITRAIAGALDHAHRHGVIHRDLKPENILLADGQPLIADFGIALAVTNAGGNRITQTGLSLGTPQYMSPEQASGDRAIDSRTDIYSLGAIAYEMLTGEPPHTGTTAQAVLARLMTEAPRPIRGIRASVPEQVEAAVEHALEKLPADRFATAREFEGALSGEFTMALRAASHAAPSRRARLLVGALAALVVLLAANEGRRMLRSAPLLAPGAGRFSIDLADSTHLPENVFWSVAIDQAGEQIAIVAEHDAQAGRAIYVRRLDDIAPRRVPGTDGGISPRFSPDGRLLAFRLRGTIQVVPVVGGSARTVASGAVEYTWVDNDRIVYHAGRELWMVSVSGGEPHRIAGPDSATRVSNLVATDALPDGKHVLVAYYRGADAIDSTRIGILSLASGKVEDIGQRGFSPRYSATGHLLFGEPGGGLSAVSFDWPSRRVTGAPRRIAEHVPVFGFGIMDAGVAANGTLVYLQGDGRRGDPVHLFSVNRRGTERQLTTEPDRFKEPRISPDGARVVVRRDPSVDTGDLWIFDLATRQLTRLTADSLSIRGEWTADGSRVVYIQRKGDSAFVAWRYWDRRGPDSVLARGLYEAAGGFNAAAPSRGSEMVALRLGSSATNPNVWVAALGDIGKRRPVAVAQSSAAEIMPALSPDGKLVAYASDESGRYEVYLTSAVEPGPRVTVSTAGGVEPQWSPDGRTLFFRAPTHFAAANISARPLAVTRRDSLFADRYERYQWHQAYNVFPDGEHLLVMRRAEDRDVARGRVRVLTNWPALLSQGGASPR